MAERPAKRLMLDVTARDDISSHRPGHHFGDVHISGPATVQLGDRYAHSQQDAAPSTIDSSDHFNTLLKSLLFDRIDFRFNNVKKALLSTCEWLPRHPHFLAWSDNDTPSPHNGFLWIKGKPGCGKSTLMKTALEWTKKAKCNQRVRQTIVPYFFNARAASSLEKSALGLYRTVAHQLLSINDALHPFFIDRFALKTPGERGENWTLEELQTFLCDSVEFGGHMSLCLFIDALDEAEHEEDARQMIRFLIELSDRARAADGSCWLQICLSSRHYPHITIGRGLSLVVEEQPEHNADIKTYIQKELTCSEGLEKDMLLDKMLEKSAHIFLWVVLVVAILNKLDDDGAPLSDMQARLDTIPENLNDLFRDILQRSDHGIETSVLFFQWTVFGMRSLEPAELFVAMEYSRSPTDQVWTRSSPINVPSSDRLRRYIINCSRGLVEIAEVEPGHPPVVQFIHETVREFLLKEKGLVSVIPVLATNLVGISQEILRIACLRCISANSISDEYQPYRKASHRNNASWDDFRRGMRSNLPFLDYAIRHLFEHAEQAQKHDIPQLSFLRQQIDTNGLWVSSHRLWWNILERYATRKVKSDVPLLHFFVERQYLSLLSVLLNLSSNSNSMYKSHGTVLQLASNQGDVQTVQMLLDKRVNVNAQGGKYANALYAASYGGHGRVVQILLDKGANICAEGGHYGNALQAASARGHKEVVQVLLDSGANINAEGGYCGNALQAASIRGHDRVVRMLLDRGANGNGKTKRYDNILYTAAFEGRERMVQQLLDNGADANAQKGLFNALQAASIRGHGRVVQMLLDMGGDIDAIGGYYGSALQTASVRGHEEVVQILLEKGANVNAQGGLFNVALQAASAGGDEKVLQILLGKGADVNAQGGYYGNALQAASARGHEEVVQILLEKGANVNTQGGKYGNALYAASARGHERVVQILRKAGAS